MFDRKAYVREYQKKWMMKRRTDWTTANGPCKKCGSYKNLEVDHIDPNLKITHRVWSWCETKRNEELKKCQVLCEACHKKKSAEYCRSLYKGKPNITSTKVPIEKFLEVEALTKQGVPEREACAKVGMSRGTYSSSKCRKIRLWLEQCK